MEETSNTTQDLVASALDEAYRLMSQDEEPEAEAREWIEAMVVDLADEPDDSQTPL
ncbi:MAG: hypothetical protein QOF51_1031 [Chloroflexota bacterium]|jgi:hypothetical protein|nr:hypothetical protein [Chloroflexota bacterium]